MKKNFSSKEYKTYATLKHWQKIEKVLPPDKLFDKRSKLYPLFLYLYAKTKKLYAKIPPRKTGENAFIHPVNLVYSLKEAGVTDPVVLCGALVHDGVEELVDLYKRKHRINENPEGIRVLDEYEEEVFERSKRTIGEFCVKKKIPLKYLTELYHVVRLLTRHKRDFYYRSIINIYVCPDEKIKEKAITIKLADRMHNILTIESFTKQERIYQCFKNLFILNNTKKFLIEKYGKDIFTKSKRPVVELLFKRCAKATYDAFQTILELTTKEGVAPVKTMLQLAFKKFALEQTGLGKVTNPKRKEPHPIRLYRGIIKKYDLRLHHQWEELDKFKKEECEWARKFFADFSFKDGKEINAILDYKDAYSLKEVIAYLLYIPDYIIYGFEYSNMFDKPRSKNKKR